MPLDANCTRTGFDPDFTQSNIVSPDPVQHYANMGWVGFMKIRIGDINNVIRVTSADINLKQEITKPDVIDGRIDPTVYQLGPKIVEGSFSMPLIADVADPDTFNDGCPVPADLRSGEAGDVLTTLWCWTTARGEQGRLLFSDAILEIRYANHAAFLFDSAIVNTWSLSIVQGDVITADVSVIGRGRTPAAGEPLAGWVGSNPAITDFLAPARALTWNDATITGMGSCDRAGEALFYSNQVREFNMEINNNADRFYTLNGSLFPIDVNVGKREITGSIKLLGLQEQLRVRAETNSSRFTEKNEIRMAFYIGEDTETSTPTGITFTSRDWTGATAPGSPIFDKRFVAVVFQIEEIAMTNEVLETTVNWHGMASDQFGYEAVSPRTSASFPVWI
ncbi:hypothetical protein LCGC14_1407040 [marine sediment metagenome]|uniref:Uncharacterized protein n=1 Tax=marine sediment metagenome TaxID=412755 RepID=A0A0F9JVS0_9ZZZZ